jgi:autotransporter-associated beta strand protein
VALNTGATLVINVGGTGEWTAGTSGNGTIGGLLAGLGGQSGGTVAYSGNVTIGLDTSNAPSDQTYSGNIVDVGATLGLTKFGAGTLTLSGVNTFSGNTTVNAGTLSLAGGSALADSTTLYVASSAKINLAANETVDKLYINGLEAQAGTWGSSASGAMNQWDNYFTGTGILTVSTGSGITRPSSPGGTMFFVH